MSFATSTVLFAAACSSKSTDVTSGGGGQGNDGGTVVSGDAAASSDANVPDGGADAAVMCSAGTDFQSDGQNCGHCGKSCGGGDCIQGVCEAQLVMDTQQAPYGIHSNELVGFVDTSKVYLWEKTTADANHFKLLSAPSTPAKPVSTGDPGLLQDTPFPPDIGTVTFNAGNIYESIQPSTVGGTGQVVTKSLSNNAAPTKIFTLPAGPTNPAPSDLLWKNIAIGSDAIYVTGTVEFTSTAIYKIAKSNGDANAMPVSIATNLGQTVTDFSVFGASGSEHLFWLDYLSNRPDNSLGSGSDYFVYTVPAGGGTPVLLDDAITSASSFASDGTYVYWTQESDTGKLRRVPLANLDAAHVETVVDAHNAQEGLIVRGQYAYFMEYSDPGPVFRVNIATKTLEQLGNRTVGASVKNSYLFGADSGFLYMTSIDGPVYRLPIVP